jgi:hypothetical protein
MPAKHGFFIESCKKYKYFYSVRAESSPRAGSSRPKNHWIGHGGPGQLIFLILRDKAGRGMEFFGRFRAERAGTVAGWELAVHKALHCIMRKYADLNLAKCSERRKRE